MKSEFTTINITVNVSGAVAEISQVSAALESLGRKIIINTVREHVQEVGAEKDGLPRDLKKAERK